MRSQRSQLSHLDYNRANCKKESKHALDRLIRQLIHVFDIAPICGISKHVHAGEVSAGILTLNNIDYLVLVGQHPRDDPEIDEVNGVTMIYNIEEGVWIRGSKRPSVGDHHASEVINNKMYLFGGLSTGQSDIQVRASLLHQFAGAVCAAFIPTDYVAARRPSCARNVLNIIT